MIKELDRIVNYHHEPASAWEGDGGFELALEKLDIIPAKPASGAVDDRMVSDSFSRIANAYLKHKVEGYDPGNRIERAPMLDWIINNGTLGNGGVLAEVGAGTGWLTHNILKHASPGKIIVNELSPGMMSVAKEKLKVDYPKSIFEFDEGTMCGLVNVQSNSVDVVCSSNALDCAVDAESALRRQYEILKPGGRNVFSIRHPFRNYLYAGSDKEGWYWEAWKGTGGNKVLRYYRTYEHWLDIMRDTGYVGVQTLRPYPSEALKLDNITLYNLYTKRPGALIFIGFKQK